MKADAEAEVAAACPTAAIVRTSLMYGTDITSLPIRDVEAAIRGNSPMTFFTDEYRCPAHAADVADGCAALVGLPQVCGPIHIAGPEALNRAAYAAAIARWLGLNPALLRTSSLADSGLDRPGRVVLDSSVAAGLGIRCRPIGETLAI